MTMVKDGGGSFTPAPVGTHRAICTQIIELGTLPQTNPQISETFKVMIGWELCDVSIEGKDDNGMPTDRNQIVSNEYTASIGDKSNLGKHLGSWRGRAFTDEERKGFQLETILGQPALLSIQHKTSATGTTYAKVGAVMGPQKTDRANYPSPNNELIHYEVKDGTKGSWDKLPEWVQKKIATSPEFLAVAGDSLKQTARNMAPQSVREDDDIPF